MTIQLEHPVLPAPHIGKWVLALNPDGYTVTLAMRDDAEKIVNVRTDTIEGGWMRERNPKLVPTLKGMADYLNDQVEAYERLNGELGGITVCLVPPS